MGPTMYLSVTMITVPVVILYLSAFDRQHFPYTSTPVHPDWAIKRSLSLANITNLHSLAAAPNSYKANITGSFPFHLPQFNHAVISLGTTMYLLVNITVLRLILLFLSPYQSWFASSWRYPHNKCIWSQIQFEGFWFGTINCLVNTLLMSFHFIWFVFLSSLFFHCS